MEQEIKELLDRYYEGQTTLDDEKKLKQYFERSDIPAGLAFEKAFFLQAIAEKQVTMPAKAAKASLAKLDNSIPVRLLWPLQVAAAVVLMATGYWLGYQTQDGNINLAMGSGDTTAEKNIFLSLDYQNSSSASDRILVLNHLASTGIHDESSMLQAIHALHFDPNVNVRMEALKVLQSVATDKVTADALIRALGIEKDPIIQITLIETIGRIKDKRAIDGLRSLAENESNLVLVREMAAQTIQVIQAGNLFQSV